MHEVLCNYLILLLDLPQITVAVSDASMQVSVSQAQPLKTAVRMNNIWDGAVEIVNHDLIYT